MRSIDADALKDLTTRKNQIWNATTDASGRGLDEIIDSLPTIEPQIKCIAQINVDPDEIIERIKAEQKTGRWESKMLDKFRKYEVVCSECGARYVGNYDSYDEPYDFNYCPNCGARMEEVER